MFSRLTLPAIILTLSIGLGTPSRCLELLGDGFGNRQSAEIIHADDAGGNLEQGVGLCIEASGLDVDDDGQKTPEAICNARHNGPRSTGRRG
jgi:hypothetical protein